MKRLSLLLIILLANISFSQKTYKASKTTISSDYNGEKVFHVKSGKPITGIVIEKYENEEIKYEGEFVESLPTGTHMKYFENGDTKEECRYENGQMNGKYLRYHDRDNNRIQTKCYFKNGKKDGLYYELNEYGDTIKKLFYVNGVLDGKAYYWKSVPSSRGKYYNVWELVEIENYKLGIQEGFKEIYRPGFWGHNPYILFPFDEWVQGDGWEKVLYKDGENIPYEINDTSYNYNGEIGDITYDYYDRDGQRIKHVYQNFSSGYKFEFIDVKVKKKDMKTLERRRWFKNGNLEYENYTDSLVKEWFENGNLKYEIIKKHERILSEKRYYTNGNIKYEYLKSIEGDGYEKWWNEKGLLQCEGFFDKRSKWDKKYWKGTFKTYVIEVFKTYDEERLISIEHYEEGEKSGVHKYWDENDRLTESAFYSEEQIEEEKQKFVAWKKNTRFSISYKVEIVNNIIKCSYCSYKKVNKNLNFPNLNLSNYGNEKYMRKLWDEHKQIIESEIIGNIGFWNHPVFDEAIFGSECKNCGRPRVEDKKSTFENKTFKN